MVIFDADQRGVYRASFSEGILDDIQSRIRKLLYKQRFCKADVFIDGLFTIPRKNEHGIETLMRIRPAQKDMRGQYHLYDQGRIGFGYFEETNFWHEIFTGEEAMNSPEVIFRQDFLEYILRGERKENQKPWHEYADEFQSILVGELRRKAHIEAEIGMLANAHFGAGPSQPLRRLSQAEQVGYLRRVTQACDRYLSSGHGRSFYFQNIRDEIEAYTSRGTEREIGAMMSVGARRERR